MGREIERKFLVRHESWRERAGEPERFRQFYLARRDGFSARVRIIDDRSAFLTLKTGEGMSRGEFEYRVPLADARELEAARLSNVIEKRRYRLAHGPHTLEIDVFDGVLAPLIVAEIEMKTEGDAFDQPDWFGREITGNAGFSNAALAEHGLPEEFQP